MEPQQPGLEPYHDEFIKLYLDKPEDWVAQHTPEYTTMLVGPAEEVPPGFEPSYLDIIVMYPPEGTEDMLDVGAGQIFKLQEPQGEDYETSAPAKIPIDGRDAWLYHSGWFKTLNPAQQAWAYRQGWQPTPDNTRLRIKIDQLLLVSHVYGRLYLYKLKFINDPANTLWPRLQLMLKSIRYDPPQQVEPARTPLVAKTEKRFTAVKTRPQP